VQVDIEIRREAGYCLIRFVGPFELATYGEGLRRLIEHPDYPKGMPTVFDLSAADLSPITQREIHSMRAINQENAEARGRVRIGVYVPDDATLGIARMFQAMGLSPNIESGIFRTFDDAVAFATRK
jgi:hypothetical protein